MQKYAIEDRPLKSSSKAHKTVLYTLEGQDGPSQNVLNANQQKPAHFQRQNIRLPLQKNFITKISDSYR